MSARSSGRAGPGALLALAGAVAVVAGVVVFVRDAGAVVPAVALVALGIAVGVAALAYRASRTAPVGLAAPAAEPAVPQPPQSAAGPPPGPWPPVEPPPVPHPEPAAVTLDRPAPAGAWRVGDRVAGLYDVLRVHGAGAMGLVYRVRHLGWDVDLAVKSPRPELFASEADRERFVLEAQTWVSLGLHPNVCACHYVRTFDGVPRVFAEYVDGGSLRDWIDDRRLYRGGPGDALARVLDLAIQVAWGLAHAHDHAVVHQDVKPANILIDGGGTAKVTDFGLARAAGLGGGRAAPGLADGGSILVTVGGLTPAYASPEQAAGGRVGRRSDLWSFAVTVLEMFTGEVTWRVGPVAGAALAGYRARGSAAGLAVPMPSSVADVLAACLTDDPDGRPANLDEVAGRLAEAYERETGTAYGRPRSTAAQLRADELTNHALSLLDLGQTDEARAMFAEALRADPRHLEATFNSGLLRWRAGDIHDDELVAQLAAVGGGWRGLQLLAQVHLERGDPSAALPLLQRAAEQAPDDPQLRADLDRARDDRHAIGRTVCTLAQPVRPTHLSADRRVVLSSTPRRGFDGGGPGDVVGVWDAHTGHHRRDLEHRGYRQSAGLTTVSPSPDGRRVLTGSDRGVLHLWDTDTGERRDLSGDGSRPGPADRPAPAAICLAGNGRFALSRDESNRLKLWDLPGGRCLEARVGTTSLSGNGRVAVAGGRRGEVLVWDLGTGRLVYSLAGHFGEIGAVGLSQDGRFAASAELRYGYGGESPDQVVRVWDLSTGQCVSVVHAGLTPLRAVALDRGARLLLTGAHDGVVGVWDVATGRRLRTLRGHHLPVTSIRLSADGVLALTSEHNPMILNRLHVRVWEVETGRCRYTVEDAVCPPSGTSAALTGDQRGNLREWTAPREQYVCPFHLCRPAAHTELARLAARVDGLVREAEQAMAEHRPATARTLLERARRTPGMERSSSVIAAWRRLAQRSRHTGIHAVWPQQTLPDVRPGPGGLCLSADGGKALAAGEDGVTVQLWDAPSGRPLVTLDGVTSPVRSLAMSPDARVAVSSGSIRPGGPRDGRFVHAEDDYTVRVWDLATGRRRHVLQGHRSFVYSTDVSADGRLALSAGQFDNPAIRVWDLATGRCLRVIEPDSHRLLNVVFTPDGRSAVSAEEEPGPPLDRRNVVRVWDLATGGCRHVLHGHTGNVGALRISADARVLVSGSSVDPAMRVWDLTTGECLRSIDVGPSGVSSLALTTDGRYALTAGSAASVQVWDLANGQCLHTVEVPGAFVSGLGWSGDGRYAIARTSAGLRVWEVDWELEVREPADWDEGARPHLSVFLTRRGATPWTEDDFEGLLRDLRNAGYGWLRPAGVRAELERMSG